MRLQQAREHFHLLVPLRRLGSSPSGFGGSGCLVLSRMSKASSHIIRRYDPQKEAQQCIFRHHATYIATHDGILTRLVVSGRLSRRRWGLCFFASVRSVLLPYRTDAQTDSRQPINQVQSVVAYKQSPIA